MNILITGAKGFIASSIIKNADPNWNIIAVSRLGDSLAKINFACDLKEKDSVDDLIHQCNLPIDLVIHTASVMVDKNNVNDMQLFYDNVTITENLITFIKAKNISRLINFSSIAVYPNTDGEYSEDSIIQPSLNNDCLYGLSKFTSENIFEYFLKRKLTQLLHLRISQVYHETMREDRTFKIMEKELKEFNRVTIFGDGERVSNFIYLDRFIEYLEFCIKESISGVFNIGENNYSYTEFAEMVAQKLNLDSPEKNFDPRGVRSKTYINTEKFDSLFYKINQ